MINSELSLLFETISNDLKIKRFSNEPLTSFYNRLVYSAIGRWILTMYLDRDFENTDINSISKAHITLASKELLGEYKRIYKDLENYFVADESFISDINDVYTNLGYIYSKKYVYETINSKCMVKFNKSALYIYPNTSVKQMIGLGIWGSITDKSMDLCDYCLIKDNAETYFTKFIDNISFHTFSFNKVKGRLFDTDNHLWIDLKRDYVKHEYQIILIDNKYKVLRTSEYEYEIADIPDIYLENKNRQMLFKDEINRLFLGNTAFNKNPYKCKISKIYNDAYKLNLSNISLPFEEYSLLKCMVWPLIDCNDKSTFIFDESKFKDIKIILERLSIKIEIL